MPRSATALDILIQAKQRADMENSAFITDVEWYNLLNNWTARLWNKLLLIDPDRYTTEQTLIGDGVTRDFVVNPDYYGTAGVDYQTMQTQGVYVPLPRLVGEEEHRLQQTVPSIPLGYSFRYNPSTPSVPVIRLIPTPDSSSICRHRYTVAPPKYATDGTDGGLPVICIAGFEDYIILGMAIDARIKEESSVVQLRKSMQALDYDLDAAAEARSIDDAGHVHDSRKNYYIDPASYRWGRYDR